VSLRKTRLRSAQHISNRRISYIIKSKTR
jgi:hypothetical protein